MRKHEIRDTEIKKILNDVMLYISWGKIANQYFEKPSAWIYDKLNERGTTLTEEEKAKLKYALCDFAERIKDCASRL